MDIFTDKHSKLQFCRAEKSEKDHIDDFNLIKWCEQFLNNEGTFIDIGLKLGEFSILLSFICKNVVSFDKDRNVTNRLAVTSALNNRNNITIKNDIKSLYDLEKVQFIKMYVDDEELDYIKSCLLILIKNSFPPILLTVKNDKNLADIKQFVNALDYKFIKIGGYNNLYIISDNPKFQKVNEEKKEKIKEIIEGNNNDEINAILEKYNSGSDIDKWEEWYLLARHFRNISQHQKCYDCVKKSFSKDVPKDRESLLYIELSIVCFYIDKMSEGYDACEKVVLADINNWQIRNSTLQNQSFYMDPINLKNRKYMNIDLPTGYIASSSSIISSTDGFIFNLRAVNYTIAKHGNYIISDPDNIVRTRNYLLRLDKEFKLEKVDELIDRSGIQLYPKNILGIEDIRLIDETRFFATYLEVNDSRTPQICFCTYDANGSVNKIVPLMYGEKLQCEKNWMPFIKNGEIHFIYSMKPFRLFKLVDDKIELVKEINITDVNIDGFRGSGSPIPYRDGWLCTIHQVYYNNPRKYFHRFVWFDQEFTQIKYSKLFYFEKIGIEFNLSICHSEIGLLMTYSVNDASSVIGILDYAELDKMI